MEQPSKGMFGLGLCQHMGQETNTAQTALSKKQKGELIGLPMRVGLLLHAHLGAGGCSNCNEELGSHPASFMVASSHQLPAAS